MATNISKQQAVEAIKGMFEILPFDKKENAKSFFSEKEGKVSFWFDKRQYLRFEVINKLTEYFADKNIVGGQCRVESLTILWTVVHIENRVNNE